MALGKSIDPEMAKAIEDDIAELDSNIQKEVPMSKETHISVYEEDYRKALAAAHSALDLAMQKFETYAAKLLQSGVTPPPTPLATEDATKK
jgi:hypothetical protein